MTCPSPVSSMSLLSRIESKIGSLEASRRLHDQLLLNLLVFVVVSYLFVAFVRDVLLRRDDSL